jgi:hypothetical protein
LPASLLETRLLTGDDCLTKACSQPLPEPQATPAVFISYRFDDGFEPGEF